jgi:flavin-dependent dehydrogenase
MQAVGIVGGGLAGLTLSIQLAKQGIEVLLFEKEQYPFHKVCGEYIAMESWNYLGLCGIPLSQLDLPRITRLKVSAPNGRFLEHDLHPGGFGISRFTLDSLLAEEAVRSGVKLHQNTLVEDISFQDGIFYIKTEKGTYETGLVVGSYGKRSNIDKKLHRKFMEKALPPSRNYLAVKYHIRTNELDNQTIELHNFKDGYCGISKVEGDRYCLCYLTTAKNLRDHGSIFHMEEEVLHRNPFLNRYFRESEFLYEAPLVISQINFEDKSAVENHILMAGDSAGLITPLCGNGMSMALHASKLLAECIPLYLKGEISRQRLETQYQKTWVKHFSTRIRAGRLIQYSFGKEVLSNWMVKVLKPYPSLVGKLEALTHGNAF